MVEEEHLKSIISYMRLIAMKSELALCHNLYIMKGEEYGKKGIEMLNQDSNMRTLCY